MSEWKEKRLEDLTQLIIDCPHSTPKWKSEGVIVLRNQNIRNGRLDLSTPSFTDEEGYKSRIKRAIPSSGDIVLTREAPMGEVCKVPENLKCCLGQRMVLIRTNAQILNSDFLLYSFQAPSLRHQILWNEGTGTTVSNIRIPYIKDFLIKYPNIEEQKQIAKTLSNLDKKITLLRQQNQTLEELAQTLFKRWFVEFEFPCLPSGYRPQGQVNLEEMAKVCTFSRVGGVPAPDGQSWFVYVLLCEDGSFYKGMTNDLYRRFYEHCTGDGAKHTKTHKPVKVIHWEQFDTQDEARAREEELKTGFGRTWLQREYDKLQKYGHTTSDGLPAHQTKLVPAGKMVKSELGEIPENFKVNYLNTFISDSIGGDYGKEEATGDYIKEVTCLRGTDLPDMKTGLPERAPVRYIKAAKLKKCQLKNGDLVIEISGGTEGQSTGRAMYINTEILSHYKRPMTCVNFCRILRPYKSSASYFVFLLLDSLYRLGVFFNLENGSTGIKNLDLKTFLNDFELALPPMFLIERFNESIRPLFKKTQENNKKIQTLTQLRDTLLPKLMSGEVRVKSV